MRIAVSSTGKDIKDSISYVFGRCDFFIFVDADDKRIKSFKAVENEGKYARGGAGIRAVQEVGNNGADALIVMRLGPKAYDLIRSVGIKAYQGVEGSVEENVKRLIKGELRRYD